MYLSLGMKFSIVTLISVIVTAGCIMLISIYDINIITKTFVNSTKTEMMSNKKQELESYVEIASSLVADLNSNSSMERSELLDRAKEIIRSFSFDDGNYIFIMDKDVNMIVHRVSPELENTNVRSVRSGSGQAIFTEMADIALRDGSGFTEYHWNDPDTGSEGLKLSYVSYFEPWGWIIGSGFFIDDIEQQVAANERVIAENTRELVVKMVLAIVLIVLLVIAANIIMVRVLTKSLGQTATVLKNISEGEGDLTTSISASQKDEVGTVAENFNKFIDKLRELIINIKQNAVNVASASAELTATSEQISATFSGQTSQISDVAAATEELTSSSREVLDALNQGAERTQEALRHTNEGRTSLGAAINEMTAIKEKVEDLGSAVTKLSESSDEIGSIISVIDDIADQTNLLALNAAIEAARAGDAGRGFAVVADEVRKLAERTQRATGEVGVIIESLSRETGQAEKGMKDARAQVEAGVKVINDTGTVFNQIVSTMETVEQVNGIISNAVREQTVTIVSINDNTQVLSSGLEESSVAMREVTNTITDLQKQADELSQLVGKFKTE